MRFTRLRLNGFKSFVDPTDLVIADGLTGVVGPNGCGKSNLLEALRWVMGENRPTAMRGGGMEDVIFAGAATRPPRNFAEVALLVDNSERLAPAEFNDADQLEIVRRITRDAGSAYRIGQRDVRARDVQMLFADASTGAHSPALVRQGQIAELINAKPKARRRILEEAAGISGLYQRRHEAELKLKGAETNLGRLDDVIDQLAGQLQQLARQARQAARYREIGAELRRAEGMLLYRRWAEAEAARSAAEAALDQAVRATAAAEGAAARARREREQADAALPPLREEAAIAAAVLQRLVVERDKLSAAEDAARDAVARLGAQIVQLGQDLEREEALNRDAGETIARLEAEAEGLEADGAGFDDALAEAEHAAREAATALQAAEAAFAVKGEDVARLTARHHSAHRLLEDAQRGVARTTGDLEKAEAALAAARAAAAEAERAEADARERAERAMAEATAAEAALAEADQRREAAQGAEAEARAARSEAEGEAGALRAEVAALARLVQRDASEAGQVLDALAVTPGFEKALGAALADDLRAPEVAPDAPSGWVALPPYDNTEPLPEGVRPLADEVRTPDVLARRLSQVGLVDPADGARLQAALRPGQRLVSQAGDLWRWDGFRAGAEDVPTAAALELEQRNRLAELRAAETAARARAEAAGAAHEAARAELSRATEADRAARQARRAADHAATEAGRALSRAEADRNLAAGRIEALASARDRHREDLADAQARLSEAEAAVAELGDLEAARRAAEAEKKRVEEVRQAMLAARAAHDELRRLGDARAARLRTIAGDLAKWRDRLATAEARAAELAERRARTEAELAEARGEPDRIQADRERLAQALSQAEARKSAADAALVAAETALREAEIAERDAERAAGTSREARAAAEARAEAARETMAAAAGRIEEAQNLTPEALLASLGKAPDDLPSAERLDTEVQKLRRQREALGAVNLRAEEDASEVAAEHDGLVAEKQDLEAAIAKLRAGIAALNREGRERLLTAFEQVNANFSMLFTHLFGGGEAKLVLVESDDPLDAGLEIMCQPPGKKLSTLSLLSGGEQTLTALALIFAVFLANPAPICVLDEVDAPLDDANVTRFCDLLDEMARRTETRFLIITHHAITMARMDRLFGVTMGEMGVSQLVSVDLKRAEAMVA